MIQVHIHLGRSTTKPRQEKCQNKRFRPSCPALVSHGRLTPDPALQLAPRRPAASLAHTILIPQPPFPLAMGIDDNPERVFLCAADLHLQPSPLVGRTRSQQNKTAARMGMGDGFGSLIHFHAAFGAKVWISGHIKEDLC